MKYIDSKGKEYDVKEMGTFHLSNAIKKHSDEIGRFNPALLSAMIAELESRTDKPVPKEDLPSVNVGNMIGSKEIVEDQHDYHQDDFESDFEINDEF